jgi:hypothetical protein
MAEKIDEKHRNARPGKRCFHLREIRYSCSVDSTSTYEATGLREACSLSLHIWSAGWRTVHVSTYIHVINYCDPLLVATQVRQASGALLLQLRTLLQQDAGQ